MRYVHRFCYINFYEVIHPRPFRTRYRRAGRIGTEELRYEFCSSSAGIWLVNSNKFILHSSMGIFDPCVFYFAYTKILYVWMQIRLLPPQNDCFLHGIEIWSHGSMLTFFNAKAKCQTEELAFQGKAKRWFYKISLREGFPFPGYLLFAFCSAVYVLQGSSERASPSTLVFVFWSNGTKLVWKNWFLEIETSNGESIWHGRAQIEKPSKIVSFPRRIWPEGEFWIDSYQSYCCNSKSTWNWTNQLIHI